MVIVAVICNSLFCDLQLVIRHDHHCNLLSLARASPVGWAGRSPHALTLEHGSGAGGGAALAAGRVAGEAPACGARW